MSATATAANIERLKSHLRRRERWRWWEIAFWLAILAAVFAVPSRAALFNEILIAGLFALSLDLILGLTGVVSLGHAAFFGLGAYTAAILSSQGLAIRTLGLVIASLFAAALGLATAPLLLRGSDLTRLMVTMGIALMLGELANRACVDHRRRRRPQHFDGRRCWACSRSASPVSAMPRCTVSSFCSCCSRRRGVWRNRRSGFR